MKKFRYKGEPLKRDWTTAEQAVRERKPKTEKKQKLQKIQANKWYRVAFGVLGFVAAVGAIVLIENKWVTVIPILVFYLIIATASAADSFATLLVSGKKSTSTINGPKNGSG